MRDCLPATGPESVYERRVRVLEHAARHGNVSETCRLFGVSRKTFYIWKDLAHRRGFDALSPAARPAAPSPHATPEAVVDRILRLAADEPTLSCRRLANRLNASGDQISKTTVHKILFDHNLSRRPQQSPG